MIEPWTRWVLRHRKSVLAVWIGLFVIGGWAASGLARSPHESLHIAGHGRGARGDHPPRSFRAEIDGLVHARRPNRRERRRDRARVARRGHARGEAPADGPLRQRPSRFAARRDRVDRLVARSGGREGPHGRDAHVRPGRSRARPSTSPARRRSSTISTPSSRATSRSASCSSRSRSPSCCSSSSSGRSRSCSRSCSPRSRSRSRSGSSGSSRRTWRSRRTRRTW